MEIFRRWPLLAVALACLAWASKLATDAHNTTTAACAFFAAIGAMFLGAWLYSVGHDDDRNE